MYRLVLHYRFVQHCFKKYISTPCFLSTVMFSCRTTR